MAIDWAGGWQGIQVPPLGTRPPIVFPDLGVPVRKQEHTLWCWAAVTSGVYNYLATRLCKDPDSLTQCQVAAHCLHQTCCPSGTCDVEYCVATALADHLVLARWVDQPSAYADIELAVRQHRPVVLRVEFDNGRVRRGHFVVVVGTHTSGADQFLHVLDPLHEDSVAAAVSYTLSERSTPEYARWTHTYFTKTLIEPSPPSVPTCVTGGGGAASVDRPLADPDPDAVRARLLELARAARPTRSRADADEPRWLFLVHRVDTIPLETVAAAGGSAGRRPTGWRGFVANGEGVIATVEVGADLSGGLLRYDHAAEVFGQIATFREAHPEAMPAVVSVGVPELGIELYEVGDAAAGVTVDRFSRSVLPGLVTEARLRDLAPVAAQALYVTAPP